MKKCSLRIWPFLAEDRRENGESPMCSQGIVTTGNTHRFRRQRELNIACLALEEHPKGDLSSTSPGFLLIDFLKKIYLFD